MPVRHVLTSLALASSLLVFAGCFGGEDDGGTTATYSPKLTEAKGTAYPDDYFPLTAGEARSHSGTMTGSMRIRMNGSSEGLTMKQDTTVRMNATLRSTIQILPDTNIAFASGARTVTPIEFSTLVSGEASGSEGGNTTAYFQKRADGIHSLGTYSNGELSENDVTLFLKLPLTVGDVWESPLGDVSSLAGDGDLTGRSRTFVVGKEDVTLEGRTVAALRLDQVAEMSGTMVDVATGMPIHMSGEFRVVSHLVQGIGQVKQSVTAKVSSSGGRTENGTSVKVNVDLDMRTTLALEASALPKASGAVPASSALAFTGPFREALRASARAAAAALKAP